ncbi:MAG: glyoxylate reductase [Calditrichia bacterium]
MKVLLTHSILPEPIDKLKQFYQVDVLTDSISLDKELLIKKIPEYDALLCLLSDPIDREVLDAAKNLKIIANYAVGYNNIDIEYAGQKGIVVTNTPDVLTDATADLTWALIMAVSRKTYPAEQFTREGKFKGWSPTLFLGKDLVNKTLGIIGAGRIGTAVIKRSVGWDMNILYVSRSENTLIEHEYYAKRVSLETLMKESDIISIHCPLTPETHYLLDKKELDLMKKDAILINTSRGPVVNETYLIHKLKNKEIYGAGFDVYEKEPIIPEELMSLDNVVLLPHIGSATTDTRLSMGYLAVDSIIQWLKDHKIPENTVNKTFLVKEDS